MLHTIIAFLVLIFHAGLAAHLSSPPPSRPSGYDERPFKDFVDLLVYRHV